MRLGVGAALVGGELVEGDVTIGDGEVAFQPTFVSSRVDAYTDPLAVAAEVAADHADLSLVTGVHLEGPFLSPLWPGAHDPVHLRTPDSALAARLVNAGPVRTITLAPELPGGLDLAERLAGAGLGVSCRHSHAGAPTAHAPLDRGTLAGSVLTMDEAVRNLVASGASLADAVHAASKAPARLLGRDDLGRLRPGAPAPLTVLDEALRVVRTLVGGVEAFAA